MHGRPRRHWIGSRQWTLFCQSDTGCPEADICRDSFGFLNSKMANPNRPNGMTFSKPRQRSPAKAWPLQALNGVAQAPPVAMLARYYRVFYERSGSDCHRAR